MDDIGESHDRRAIWGFNDPCGLVNLIRWFDMGTPSREREPVQHSVGFPPAPLCTCNKHRSMPLLLGTNYHIVQNLYIAFSFRHLTSIRVEQERQMRIFWRGERERSIEIEMQRKGGQPLLYVSFQLTHRPRIVAKGLTSPRSTCVMPIS